MTETKRVAVLGLGPMGLALARTLADRGLTVLAWNRSARPAPDAVRVCVTPEAAVASADVVLVCVRDHAASRELVARVAASVRPGVPVVNVSTGRSAEAVESARAATALGLGYVTGAVMVPTTLVGTADNLVLYAGEPDDIAAARPVLDALGGTVDVLGADHALPPVLDMAMLDVFFSGMYAFLHSSALVRAHGVEPADYLPYARGILTALDAELDGLARAYATGAYDGGQASLGMCLSFLEHIVATSHDAGVDQRLPELLARVTREQIQRSGDDVDWDVVAEGLIA
jgi:3-hydroxyisobutyrate dehydrogenase-like beta-hydroxyacid dehydrogenase